MITSIILQGLHTYLPSKLSMYAAGLPDGLFSHQKSQFWLNLEGIGIENVAIFYDLLEYCTTIWYNIQPFGIVCGHLVYFSILVCLDQEKSSNPGMLLLCYSLRLPTYIGMYVCLLQYPFVCLYLHLLMYFCVFIYVLTSHRISIHLAAYFFVSVYFIL
jgi:hypothetical protein